MLLHSVYIILANHEPAFSIAATGPERVAAWGESCWEQQSECEMPFGMDIFNNYFTTMENESALQFKPL